MHFTHRVPVCCSLLGLLWFSAGCGGGAGSGRDPSAGAEAGGTASNVGGSVGSVGGSGAAANGGSSSAGTSSGGSESTSGGSGGATAGGSAGSGGSGSTYVPPEGDGEPGVWTKIPQPISFTYAMSLIADPVRVNEYYSFLTDGAGTDFHVLKSTDYGLSWAVINETNMQGDPWGAAIDPNPNRDPETPAVMYTPAGYGSSGVFKSTDGGVNWTQMGEGLESAIGSYSQYPWDTYSITILPDDPPNHILATYHGGWELTGNGSDAGLAESTDGGATWVAHLPPDGMGTSHYMMIVDENTWLTVSQSNNGDSGIWRTTTAGRVDGNISTAAWENVDDLEHVHGAFNPTKVGTTLYAAGDPGIRRSTDDGATWTSVYATQTTGLIATENYIYADFILGHDLIRASVDADTSWATYGSNPEDMKGGLGPGTSTHVTSSDGAKRYVVINVNGGGTWRYIEPAE
jgi:hypothetical protein